MFTEKTAKTEHMKSHSGDKVYPCSVCGTLFTNKAKLEEHMDEHKVSSSYTDQGRYKDNRRSLVLVG